MLPPHESLHELGCSVACITPMAASPPLLIKFLPSGYGTHSATAILPRSPVSSSDTVRLMSQLKSQNSKAPTITIAASRARCSSYPYPISAYFSLMAQIKTSCEPHGIFTHHTTPVIHGNVLAPCA